MEYIITTLNWAVALGLGGVAFVIIAAALKLQAELDELDRKKEEDESI